MSDIASFTEVVTRSGLSLSLRPVTRDDGPLLRDFFDRVTPEDLRFRFLTAMLKVSDDQIASMIDVDHKQTEDFLAFADNGTLVGSAMIAIEPSGERAEVAIWLMPTCKLPTMLLKLADICCMALISCPTSSVPRTWICVLRSPSAMRVAT